MNKDLKDCPFCGGTDTEVLSDGFDFFGHCNYCASQGPNEEKRHQAIEAWNFRSTPAIAEGYTVTPEQYARLCEMLDAPPKDLPGLRELLTSPVETIEPNDLTLAYMKGYADGKNDHDILMAINDLAQCCELPDMDVHAVVVKHKDVINRAYAYWNKLTYDANPFGEGI
jgi:Lar family restriction alleviation protein